MDFFFSFKGIKFAFMIANIKVALEVLGQLKSTWFPYHGPCTMPHRLWT